MKKSRGFNGISFDHILKQARASIGKDPDGTRTEFMRLVQQARRLSGDLSEQPVLENSPYPR